MVVNENAGNLILRGICEFIASRLAPTGGGGGSLQMFGFDRVP